MAEPLGFDSIWSVEHHFDDYTMCPDVLQLLTTSRGAPARSSSARWSSCCPGHDPIRVAEQVSLLDHVSNRALHPRARPRACAHRVRGLPARPNEGRAKFVEYAELVLNALETAT